MSFNEFFKTTKRNPLLILLLLGAVLPAQPAAAADDPPPDNRTLSDAEVQTLQKTLTELKTLSPKLRVLLRTLRKQVGFDPREIHNIERAMSQSEKDLERMIAMHQRHSFNKMRAHFMADDLRRKSEGLKTSLGYIERRIRELNEAPGERGSNEQLKANDNALLEMLVRYAGLVAQSLTLMQGKLLGVVNPA